MATKRTKADKEQRQADQLDKKSERRPEQGTGKRRVHKAPAQLLEWPGWVNRQADHPLRFQADFFDGKQNSITLPVAAEESRETPALALP